MRATRRSPEVGVPGGNRNTKHIDEERISQVWFAGVHSNVGGGYPDDSLSHVPLEWIMSEANKPRMEGDKHVPGIRFSQKIWDAFRALADENGPINDSRHGLAGYYRYNPRRIEKLPKQRKTLSGAKSTRVCLRRIKMDKMVMPICAAAGFAVVDSTVQSDDATYPNRIDNQSQWANSESRSGMVWWRGSLISPLCSDPCSGRKDLFSGLPKGACTSRDVSIGCHR